MTPCVRDAAVSNWRNNDQSVLAVRLPNRTTPVFITTQRTVFQLSTAYSPFSAARVSDCQLGHVDAASSKTLASPLSPLLIDDRIGERVLQANRRASVKTIPGARERRPQGDILRHRVDHA